MKTVRVWIALALLLSAMPAVAGDWSHWRGPLGTGAAPDADPPIEWSEDENVAWKVRLPGHGKSTPIVHGEHVYVLAAVPSRAATSEELGERPELAEQMTPQPSDLYAFLVLAFDRKTGEPAWETMVTERLPITGVHETNGYASFSPVAEGDRLYVSFGSNGVYALDAGSGDVLWEYEIGAQRTRRGWGEAGSPTLAGDTLFIVADQEDDSRIHALDAATGELRWKQERDEPSTWTTPLVVEAAGKTQVIVNGTTAVRSYDAETGEVLWYNGGQTVNAIPTPVTDGERVVCASGYRGSACFALSLAGSGDLSASEGGILWSHSDGTPYVPSPVLVDGRVYMLSKNSGRLTCIDMASGELLLDRHRLDLSSVYASPLAAGGRLYVVGREGTTIVLRHKGELEVLATNVLDEPIDATPVAVGNVLYLRSETSLYAIGTP